MALTFTDCAAAGSAAASARAGTAQEKAASVHGADIARPRRACTRGTPHIVVSRSGRPPSAPHRKMLDREGVARLQSVRTGRFETPATRHDDAVSRAVRRPAGIRLSAPAAAARRRDPGRARARHDHRRAEAPAAGDRRRAPSPSTPASSRSTRRTTARPSSAPPSPAGSPAATASTVDPETRIIAAQRQPRGPVQRRPRPLPGDASAARGRWS